MKYKKLLVAQKTFNWKTFFLGILYSILLLIILFYVFQQTQTYKTIVYPSYLSVISACSPNGNDYIESKGYTQGGQFNASDQTITIFLDDTDSKILKHETCHLQQAERHRSFSCSNRFYMWMNEISAYYSETHNYTC